MTSISLSDFRLGDAIGRGATSIVYEATHIASGVVYALKTIDKKRIREHDLTARIRSEVTLHSQLVHQHIVRLHTFFEDSNSVFLVLESCPNASVYRFLKTNGSISLPHCRLWTNQLVHGLDHLHKNFVIHRDLKLSNLLLDKDLNLKIADFGMAAKWGDGEERNTLCGTPNFIAPETIQRQQQGPPVDIWSLGVIIFNMIVGNPPFEADNIAETFSKVTQTQYKIPEHVPSLAKDLINKLLTPNPKHRLQLQEILQHPFLRDDLARPPSPISYRSSMVSLVSQSTSALSDLTPQRKQFVTHSASHNLHSRLEGTHTGHTSPDAGAETKHVSGKEQTLRSGGVSFDRNEAGFEQKMRSSFLSSAQSSHIHPHDWMPKPLPNTNRLQPIVHKNRTGYVAIAEDGKVQLVLEGESPSRSTISSSTQGSQYMFSVSGDGREIQVGKMINDNAVIRETYTVDTLPYKYQKKYMYVASFVELVRSKTPKVTIYAPHGRFMLMENNDFDFRFASGSHYILKDNEEYVTIRNQESNRTANHSVALTSDMIPEGQQTEIQAMRQRCLQLATLSGDYLPVVCGTPSGLDLSSSQRSAARIDGQPSEELFRSSFNSNTSTYTQGSRV